MKHDDHCQNVLADISGGERGKLNMLLKMCSPREVFDNGKSHFDFNDDVVIDNDFVCKEVKENDSGKVRESTMWTRDGSMRKNSIMDGLPKPPPRREYMMTNRVPRIISSTKDTGASRDAEV